MRMDFSRGFKKPDCLSLSGASTAPPDESGRSPTQRCAIPSSINVARFEEHAPKSLALHTFTLARHCFRPCCEHRKRRGEVGPVVKQALSKRRQCDNEKLRSDVLRTRIDCDVEALEVLLQEAAWMLLIGSQAALVELVFEVWPTDKMQKLCSMHKKWCDCCTVLRCSGAAQGS